MLRLLVGCCVPPSTGSHRNSRPRSSIYVHFFVALFDPRKQRVNILPHTFRPVASPLQLHIYYRHSFFGLTLLNSFRRRHCICLKKYIILLGARCSCVYNTCRGSGERDISGKSSDRECPLHEFLAVLLNEFCCFFSNEHVVRSVLGCSIKLSSLSYLSPPSSTS